MAQPGSAPALGAGGREFKSPHPDHSVVLTNKEIGVEVENKIRAHDGLVGATNLLSVILGVTVSTQWLWIAGVVAALQILSPVTRFCPVYFVLNKVMPDTEPVMGRSKV